MPLQCRLGSHEGNTTAAVVVAYWEADSWGLVAAIHTCCASSALPGACFLQSVELPDEQHIACLPFPYATPASVLTLLFPSPIPRAWSTCTTWD